MEAIVLSFRGEPLRVFPVLDRPLEVGSGPGCDVVVHDATVPDRGWLVRRGREGVVVHDLREGRVTSLDDDVELRLSERYGLSRAPEAIEPTSAPIRSRTEPLPVGLDASEHDALCLVIGRGREARRVRIGSTPLTIGSAPDCDLVLVDRAVSAHHCRIEPAPFALWVRDLGSRNGTWLDGGRVGLGQLAPGSRLRIGRTDIAVVEVGRPGDARGGGLVAASPQMMDVLAAVERLARVPFPVLVSGPSGAGKEGIARALHARGPRAKGPFVAINAAAIPKNLVESELFGHEKGAFTGAESTRRGVFEQADRGTLFLDEVGELSLSIQARLLRVLESWTFRRVGGEVEHKVDVRLVCATHRDLRQLVARGAFRADLYYRLVQAKIEIPPLSERPDDVRALAFHFLAHAVSVVGPRSFAPEALDALVGYAWPGNARELRSVVHSAAASASGEITRDDVMRAIESIAGPTASTALSLEGARAVVERYGSISEAARALGVSRTTLRDRLARGGPVLVDGRRRRRIAS